MGNDILTITHNQKKYIKHQRIPLPQHLQRVSSTHFQKIFGTQQKTDYLKSQSMPIFEVKSESQKEQEQIEEEQENAYEEMNELDSLHFNDTIEQTSLHPSQQNDTIKEFYNHVNVLKQRLFEQNFNSRSFSPVKYDQKFEFTNKTVNGSIQRKKQHYFRLKGCETQSKQNYDQK